LFSPGKKIQKDFRKIYARVQGWMNSLPPVNGSDIGPRPDLKKLEEWAAFALSWASETLDANPPMRGDNEERNAALHAIDDVLHVGAASELEPVVQFFRSRMARATKEIEKAQISSGLRIWKMYNHGFVVKTRATIMGFDLIRGYGSTVMDADVAGRLAGIISVSTISHHHVDHADLEICRMISENGGEILTPSDLYERWSKETGLRLVEMAPGSSNNTGFLTLKALKGHHDGPPDRCDLNIYYLATERMGVMHTGDHWINRRRPLETEDEELLEKWGARYSVDVLLLNRSPYQFQNIVDRIKPRNVISSHENELSHDIAARATYGSSIRQMEPIKQPCLTMAWGESCPFEPGK